MGNFLYPKMFYLKKSKPNNYIISDLKAFENGNLLLISNSNIRVFDNDFKNIFYDSFDSVISCTCIINNKNFIAANSEDIFLFSESLPNENNYENVTTQDFSIPLIGEKTFIKKKIFNSLPFLDLIIYNKKKNLLFIKSSGSDISVFDVFLKNNTISLKSILKTNCSISSFIIFNNRYIISKIKYNHEFFLCIDGNKMKRMLPNIRYSIDDVNKENDANDENMEIQLFDYNNKYFIYTICKNLNNYLYLYDFYNKVINKKFNLSFLFPTKINFTKNYILVSDMITLYIYNRKTLYLLQTKRMLNPSCFIDELKDDTIGVFRPDSYFYYSKDQTGKIIFFIFLRFLTIFLLLYSLIKSICTETIGVWYVIKNCLKFDLIIYILFGYNSNSSFIWSSDFF
jgi:hypothetical protein